MGAENDVSAAVRNTGSQRRCLEKLDISRVGLYHPTAYAAFVNRGKQQAEHHIHIAEPPAYSRQSRQIKKPVKNRYAACNKRRKLPFSAARYAAFVQEPDKRKNHAGDHPAETGIIQRTVRKRRVVLSPRHSAAERKHLLVQVVGDYQQKQHSRNNCQSADSSGQAEFPRSSER